MSDKTHPKGTATTGGFSSLFGVSPPYAINRSRYNMNSFTGRVAYYFNAINPLYLLETDASLQEHRRILEAAKNGTLPKDVHNDKELWGRRMRLESCAHPTTGEPIPAPFRMAAFIPVNFVIVPLMMMPSTVTSVWRTIGIHWANQSFNALVNYSNRGSDALPLETMLKAYTAAVAVSVSGALAGTFFLRRLKGGSAAATLVRALVPMAAVAGSGCANVALMRTNEWLSDGVRIRDEDGRDVGRSCAAGRIGLFECCVTRVLWNIPSMTLPPLCVAPIMALCPRMRAHPQLLEILLIYFGLILGVPPALAYYPPIEHCAVDKLEPQFQVLRRANGEPVQIVSFVKGL